MPASKIGGRTLTQALDGKREAPPSKVGASTLTEKLDNGAAVHRAAAAGVAGGGGALPHGDAIQRAFGHHDISGIRAHVGGSAEAASRAIGARAYATGDQVAFAGAPSLHTAAHEAAHVVQQRAGIQLEDGVGATGDGHEQHADAVADAVVQGRSAQGLLDQYVPAGGGVAVQRGLVQRDDLNKVPANQPANHASPQAATAVLMARLYLLHPTRWLVLPLFDGIDDGTFDIQHVTAWLDDFVQLIDDVKVADSGHRSPDLIKAIDDCVSRNVPELQQSAAQIRAATIQLTNDSSVSKKDPAEAIFPPRPQVMKLAAGATKLGQLARDPTLPAGEPAKAAMQAAATVAQDAALAMLQSLSVVNARDRWKRGDDTRTPANDRIGKDGTAVDEVFDDAGHGAPGASIDTTPGKNYVYDWCGYFVAASYFKGATLASQLRAGFDSTGDAKGFFEYSAPNVRARVPTSIWADGKWWDLRSYHNSRGALRKWTERAAIQAALKRGDAGDIRPGDTCLIDHSGVGSKADHIVMVESYDPLTKQLVTIEGNTFGVHAGADQKAERFDDDHLKADVQHGATAAGIHVRDMRAFVAGPGQYLVNNSIAYVRDDANLSKRKTENSKDVKLPRGFPVEVTEVKPWQGKQFAHVLRWGWTLFDNLTPSVSQQVPAGAHQAEAGATVWGVGRPSLVDFEDGHDYAVFAVPSILQTTSPQKIRELAQKKGAGSIEAQIQVK